MTNVKTFMFKDDGKIPNHPTLSLVVYKDVIQGGASACRAMYQRNQWDGIWLNGVYRFHHYHSTAHEVLGCVSGRAKVQFGGEDGEILEVVEGDVVVIPAGVGHYNTGDQSNDFQIMGAYPMGQTWDLCRGESGERPRVLDNISNVPLPKTDPVQGIDGILLDVWSMK
jgi:uncharacterized protein YjlB